MIAAFKCTEGKCTREFTTRQALDNHRKAKHGKQHPARMECPMCGRKVRPDGLDQHLEMAHA